MILDQCKVFRDMSGRCMKLSELGLRILTALEETFASEVNFVATWPVELNWGATPRHFMWWMETGHFPTLRWLLFFVFYAALPFHLPLLLLPLITVYCHVCVCALLRRVTFILSSFPIEYNLSQLWSHPELSAACLTVMHKHFLICLLRLIRKYMYVSW